MKRVGWSRGLVGLVVALSALLASASAAAAPPCTDTWVGGSGNWFVASNWSSGTVPGPNDAVCITAPGSYTITIPGGPGGSQAGQAVADTLVLGAASGYQKLVIQADNACGDTTGAGGLEVFDHTAAPYPASIGPSAQLELTQDGDVCSGSANGSYLRVDAGTLFNAGQITSDAGSSAGASNPSQPATGRTIAGSIANAGGTVSIDAATSWLGTRLDNKGTIRTDGPVVLTVPAGAGATVVNDTGGAIVDNPSLNDNAVGDLRVDPGNTFEQGAGTADRVSIAGSTLIYTGTGSSNIGVGGQSTLIGNVPAHSFVEMSCSPTEAFGVQASSFTNAGVIQLDGIQPGISGCERPLSVAGGAGPGTGTLTNTGRIDGSGTIAGNVSNATGTVSPGMTPAPSDPCQLCFQTGSIAIAGDYSQGAGGTLTIPAYANGIPGVSYSQLSVSGAASIGGTLKLFTGPGDLGPAGAKDLILPAGSITGRFRRFDGQPDPSYGVQLFPVYGPTSVSVEVVNSPKLTVRIAGQGWGTVTTAPYGIVCAEGSCEAAFGYRQTVTLYANPSQSGPFGPSSTFAGWSGAGCHDTRRCTVTMDGNKSVTATFLPPSPQCTLRLTSRRPTPALTAVAVCDKSARLRLSGTVTAWLGRGPRAQPRHFQLRPVTGKALRGRKATLVVTLPTGAIAALRQGRRTAIRLTLAATGAGGTSHNSTRPIALRS